MTTSEKVAYLKGLAAGLAIDAETKEGKLFKAIIDVLEDIALDLEDLEENALDLGEEIDGISDDLAELEDIIYEDEDEEGDECGCCIPRSDEPVFFEVTCPSCQNTITIDEDVLDMGSIDCPSCGEILEFDTDEEDEDEE